MELVVGALSSILSILTFCIFGAGVMKIFQMATTLTEIKDLLAAMKTRAPIQPPSVLPAMQSGEEMLRALTAEMDQPVSPASVELSPKS